MSRLDPYEQGLRKDVMEISEKVKKVVADFKKIKECDAMKSDVNTRLTDVKRQIANILPELSGRQGYIAQTLGILVPEVYPSMEAARANVGRHGGKRKNTRKNRKSNRKTLRRRS
jgi:hypothetical protein